MTRKSYRAIVESAVDYAIITLDLSGRVTGWNRGAQAVLGWDEAEVVGQQGDLIFTSEDRAANMPEVEMKKALSEGRAADERWHVRRDGTLFWASGQLTPLYDGSLHGFLKILRDHTEQRRAAERLRASEERFRTLAEGIPQLVWRSRSNGERTWGSPQWVAYSGLSEEDSLGLGWLDAVHSDDREGTLAAWAEAERSGSFSADYRVRRAKDGVYRWFQGRGVPVCDETGRIIEWLGTATDIDDQVRAREVLARGHEELERLVAARTSDLAQALEALRAEAAERGQAEEALRQSQKMEAVGRVLALAKPFLRAFRLSPDAQTLYGRRDEVGVTAQKVGVVFCELPRLSAVHLQDAIGPFFIRPDNDHVDQSLHTRGFDKVRIPKAGFGVDVCGNSWCPVCKA